MLVPYALAAIARGEHVVYVIDPWTGWESIEAATHGNIRRPTATSNAARLVGGTATHYEVVPGAAHRSGPSAGSAIR